MINIIEEKQENVNKGDEEEQGLRLLGGCGFGG